MHGTGRTVGLAMLAAVAVGGCSIGNDDGPGIAPTGSGTTRSYAADGFSKIELAGSDDVDVRAGTAFSVRAEGPADELDQLRIARDGDTLSIGRRHRAFGWGRHDKVKVFVTLPRLAEASIAGSGTMAVDRIEGGSFEGNIAGSGDLNIAALAVDEAEVSIAGSGNVRAGGAVKRLEVDVAGSGSFDAAGLRAERAEVTVAGSGDVRAAVAGEAKVELMGSGDVDLGAQARCRVSKTGSGSVRCGTR
ncbi:head GIN domain-containing protein [Sphingomonas sp. CLY1604]|uniref:head GIN domain-containing protein n=1 Tax=Sphingomonas sp. CLY1604 TaxID=3457786 RepID=UPI003FD7B5E2